MMSTRYYSLPLYPFILFIVALPSLSFFSSAHSMEKGTTYKSPQNAQSAQIGEFTLKLDAESLQNAQDAAFKGLKTMLLQLVKTDTLDERHAKDLGLEPNDFVALTSSIGNHQILGDAIRVFHVRLKDLRDFAPGQAERNLLIDTQQLLFPVKIGNDDKFSIAVQSVPRKNEPLEYQARAISWRPTKWGLPNLTRRLSTQQKCSKDRRLDAKEYSLVSIPALNRNFLGYQDNGEIKLIPLTSGQDCMTGAALSVKDVFLGLIEEAKKVGDSPR
jgi:hypothetical protein